MRVSQLVVWAIVALVLVCLWLYGPEDTVAFKLLRSIVILIVGMMVASLCTVKRME